MDAFNEEAFPALARNVNEKKPKKATAGPGKKAGSKAAAAPAGSSNTPADGPDEPVKIEKIKLKDPLPVVPELKLASVQETSTHKASSASSESPQRRTHSPEGVGEEERGPLPLSKLRRLAVPAGATAEELQDLANRQIDEIISLKAIFGEGAVQELEVQEGSTDLETSQPASSERSPSSAEAAEPGSQPSALARRYIVFLNGKAGSMRSVGPSKAKVLHRPGAPEEPELELEVQYGQLYPAETPMLLFRKVENVPKQLAKSLHELIWQKVAERAGSECIYEVCEIIAEKLEKYTNEVVREAKPLHELMLDRNREANQRKEEELLQEQLKAKKQAEEEWLQKMQAEDQRLRQYKEKQEAAKRVEAGVGTLDFLRNDDHSEETEEEEDDADGDDDEEEEAAGDGATADTGASEEQVHDIQHQGGRSHAAPARPAPPAREEISRRFRDDTDESLFMKDDFTMGGFSVDFQEETSGSVVFDFTGMEEAEVQQEKKGGTQTTGPQVKGSAPQATPATAAASAAVAAAAVPTRADPAPKIKVDSPRAPAKPTAAPPERRGSPKHSPAPSPAASPPPKKNLTTKGAASPKPPKQRPAAGLSRSPAPNSSAARAPPSPRGRGRYALDFEELGFLGQGGFGSVMKVRNRVDRQLYAIKRIDLAGTEGDRSELLQECATLPRLTHLNIVRYYQAWIESEQEHVEAPAAPMKRQNRRIVQRNPGVAAYQADDWLSITGRTQGIGKERKLHSNIKETLFIQMEYCDGNTLRQVLDSGELVKDEALIWKLFRQVLDALAYVHMKGLIHRDLKPSNVFLSKEDGGHAKLGDFGLTTEVLTVDPTPDLSPEAEKGRPHRGKQQQAVGVGTPLYMAPEVRSRASSRATTVAAETPPVLYDQKADMFSLGVMFYEMWNPPFGTAMERAVCLGRLAPGLEDDQDMQKLKANMPQGTPREVLDILASLLARDPAKRMNAETLLNHSGLLPPGAYDPQVQRMLKALQDPLSSESVALIQAVFSRQEEESKDVPFFEQLFKRAMSVEEAEIEARDALMHLLRRLCRKHHARHELCPLLRPVHSAREGAASTGPCRVVDAGNTVLELRTDLTEPFARAAVARIATDAGDGDARRHARREYHMGTVYRESPASEKSAAAQFGHPMEIYSAAVQFLWWAAGKGDPPVPASVEHAHEAEVVHIVAELMSAAGIGGVAEIKITDTQLLPLLLLGAAHRIQADEGSSGAVAAEGRTADKQQRPRRLGLLDTAKIHIENLEAVFAEACSEYGGTKDIFFLSRVIEAFRLELPRLDAAAADVSRCLHEAEGKSTTVLLQDLEMLYTRAAGDTDNPSEAWALSEQQFLQQQLRGRLRSLRAVATAVEGLVEVKLDLLHPIDWSKYGLGMVFMVNLMFKRDGQRDTPILVCKGGRLDRMLSHFRHIHGRSSLDPEMAARSPRSEDFRWGELQGASFELAVHKLAEALSQTWTQSAAHSAAQGRRPRGFGGTSVAPNFLVPWWKQRSGSFPHIILNAECQAVPGHFDEAMRLVSGLWRLGVPCDLCAGSTGPFDAETVNQKLWPVQADFVLRLKSASSGEASGEAATSKGDQRPSQDEPSRQRDEERRRKDDDKAKSKKRFATSEGSTAGVQLQRQSTDPLVKYSLEAHSDQARQALEGRQSGKDRFLLDFDDRHKVFEFIEGLMRRIPPRPLGLPMPRLVEPTL